MSLSNAQRQARYRQRAAAALRLVKALASERIARIMGRFVEIRRNEIVNLDRVCSIVYESERLEDGRYGRETWILKNEAGHKITTATRDFDATALLDRVLPVGSAVFAAVVFVRETDERPTKDDVEVLHLPVAAWRSRAGGTVKPVLPVPVPDGATVYLALAGKAFVRVGTNEVAHSEDALRGIALRTAQTAWDEHHVEDAASEPA